MPLEQEGIVSYGSRIDRDLQQQIEQFFKLVDQRISELSELRHLSKPQVRLLQPNHLYVMVTDMRVLVVLSVYEVGGIRTVTFAGLTDNPGMTEDIDIAVLLRLAERDLSFRSAFGFEFRRAVLDWDDEQKRAEVDRIASEYLDEEVARLEKMNRLVRINPVFQGREFLLKDNLVFVLSPFSEPFDTIYKDHIKPSIEAILPLTCLRADDIYDNRPIIEDIWRCTNEARIVVAELTSRNPNVFYETGIAHTIGKEVILITQSMDDVPFDLRHLRCIVYEYTPKGIKNLEDNLKSTVMNILTRH